MKKIVGILIAVALSAELWILLDVLLALFCSTYVPYRYFALICLAILIISLWLSLKYRKTACVFLLCISTLLAVATIEITRLKEKLDDTDFVQSFAYKEVDFEKEALFSGKRVMLIVPHEDDDINVLGGVMEEYIRYGSEIYVVFMTNGDYYGRSVGEFRINEALLLYQSLGVPENHVIFLGYGEGLCTENYHLYNANSDEVITSQAGETVTYGIATHPAFREGREYTKDHLLEDLEDVILQIRPDIIFCVDYDAHVDHRTCSLLFEKATGDILHFDSDYSPEVYKGYAYSTSWNADHDYFAWNMKATQNVFVGKTAQFPPVYRWDERIRMPIRAALLSRLYNSSGLRDELGYYDSQEASSHGLGIINGDKVFWKRATNSLCRNAVINVSSGDGTRLNDFMLLDTNNMLDLSYSPFDGVWTPEKNDEIKTATVKLNTEENVSEIVLYDNPAEDSNVLSAEIRLSDGTFLETGPLDAAGAATRFELAGNKVSSFQIQLTVTEGECAGLSEIEVFGKEGSAQKSSFIKMMDGEGNFAYDYITGLNGRASFSLYSNGIIPELSDRYYEVECDNTRCEAVIADGAIQVKCPRNQSSTIRLRLLESGLTDSIWVQNPNLMRRLTVLASQKLELIELEDFELLHFIDLIPWSNSK